MDKHLKVCLKRGHPPLNGQTKDIDTELGVERLSAVEESLIFLRKSLNEEIQMRHDIIGELGSLKKRNQVGCFDTILLSNLSL